MEERLDPEGLGVVLLHAFMEEFYPHEVNSTPDVFTLWHYNGLSCSNTNAKVITSLKRAQIFYVDVNIIHVIFLG